MDGTSVVSCTCQARALPVDYILSLLDTFFVMRQSVPKLFRLTLNIPYGLNRP